MNVVKLNKKIFSNYIYDKEQKKSLSAIIKDLKEENEDLRNALPTVSGEGSNITLNGTAKGKFKKPPLPIGVSEQKGYNLFPSAAAETKSSNGITIECDGKGTYKVSGTSTASATIEFELQEEITFPVSVGNGGLGKLYLFNSFTGGNIYFLDNTNTKIDDWNLSSINREGTSYSALANKTCKYIRLIISAGVTIDGTISPMVTNEGNTTREYEPYGAGPTSEKSQEIKNITGNANVIVANADGSEAQTFDFPLLEGQKLMEGDYLADDGIHHVRKQVQLTGNENWYILNNCIVTTTYSDVKKNDTLNKIVVITSHFPGALTSYRDEVTVGAFAKIRGVNNQIAAKVLNIFTFEEFKNFLTNNNVTMEYMLEEEVIEPYTEDQKAVYESILKAKSYDGQTHIHSNNDPSPVFEVKALKDLDTALSTIDNRLTLVEG